MNNKKLEDFLTKQKPDLKPQSKPKDKTEKLYEKLLNKALIFVSYSARAQREVVDKLNLILSRYKNISDSDKVDYKNRIISYLREIDLLDDKKYLEDYIKSKNNSSKKKSPNQIKNYLLKKGFDFKSINQAMEQLSDDYNDDFIEDMLRKKARTFDTSNPRLSKRKITAYLVSKGVPFDKAIGSVDTYFKVK